MFLFSIPFTGGHIGYERERVAQQGFILLFFDFFSYFQMSFLCFKIILQSFGTNLFLHRKRYKGLSASHYWLTLDLWLAKDNRFLNPKSSYKRILMAPPCRLIVRLQLNARLEAINNCAKKDQQ